MGAAPVRRRPKLAIGPRLRQPEEDLRDEYLAGKYRIEVVDLLVNPQLSSEDQIIAIPTLVRQLPAPIRKIIGDLSNTEKTLVGLQLSPPPKDRGIMKEPKRQPPGSAADPPNIGCVSMSAARLRVRDEAIENIKAIGEKRLHGNYELEVIDAYQQAEVAA